MNGSASVATSTTGSERADAVSSTSGNAPWGVTGSVIVPGSSEDSEGGSGGDANDTCGVAALLEAITRQVGGVTWCSEASAMLEPDEKLSARRGAVVIDDEGRIVDVTGRQGDAKQRWLDEMAAQRWPCLAGQTIGYQCPSPN